MATVSGWPYYRGTTVYITIANHQDCIQTVGEVSLAKGFLFISIIGRILNSLAGIFLQTPEGRVKMRKGISPLQELLFVAI